MTTRITVYLSIRTETLLAAEISATLGIQPDHASPRGPDRDPPRRLPITHGWMLEVIEAGSRDPIGLLKKVLGRVEPFKDRLPLLKALDPSTKIILTICIVGYDDTERLPFVFGADTVKLIAEIGADLDIDFF